MNEDREKTLGEHIEEFRQACRGFKNAVLEAVVEVWETFLAGFGKK